MTKVFPEFSTSPSTPSSKGGMALSDIQAYIKKEIAKHGMTRTDSWSNLVTGLGGVADKSRYTEYGDYTFIDDATLSSIYMGDGLGGRIVDVVADDMTREGITIEEDGTEVIDSLETLDWEEKVNEALRWQRLYGGALLVIGVLDGQSPQMPLNINKIKSIEYLKVVDRTDISITESIFEKDPNSPDFGQVKIYKINTYIGGEYTPIFVHASRCIPFRNDPMPSRVRYSVDTNYRYWGMSSLQRIYEELRDLGGVSQSIVNILYEFLIGKFKIAHLSEIMSEEGGEDGVRRRVEIMNLTKSVLNAVLLDAESEDYSRDYATLAGLPEIVDRFMLKLAGSTGIPVTRLFGRSPAGLNATGENDLRNYYDLVEAAQRNKLKRPVQRLIELVCAWKKIKTVPKFTFNSLYQMTEKEYAEVAHLNATTAQTYANTNISYINAGVLDPDEVRHEDLGKKGTAQVDEPPADEPTTPGSKNTKGVSGNPRNQVVPKGKIPAPRKERGPAI